MAHLVANASHLRLGGRQTAIFDGNEVHFRSERRATLLLYAETDLVTPVFTYPLDYLRNKSGRIWHCRLGRMMEVVSWSGNEVADRKVHEIAEAMKSPPVATQ